MVKRFTDYRFRVSSLKKDLFLEYLNQNSASFQKNTATAVSIAANPQVGRRIKH
jgi:hypothetical protein